jgi:Linalool dehydratase/isomerase
MSAPKSKPKPMSISESRFSEEGRLSLFLTTYFALQSYLHGFKKAVEGMAAYRRIQLRSLCGYALFLICLGLGTAYCGNADSDCTTLLGLSFPGAGFLKWADGDQIILAASLFALSLAIFGTALILWFATGNILAPFITWMALALLSGKPDWFGLAIQKQASDWPWLIGPSLLAMLLMAWRIPSLNTEEQAVSTKARTWNAGKQITHDPITQPLSLETLQRLRLLLDRALQPADQFNGFERRDQFQTAAMRYQVNFASIALSVAQRNHAPAAKAYFDQAQSNLLTKIGDKRMWGYWGLENAWGNLRLDADPISHQNIMYSGFTTLQMALLGQDCLPLHNRGKVWKGYSLAEMVEVLEQQYRRSVYGLLPCEPNWIYPLCNLITMAGVKAADIRNGAQIWPTLAEPFLQNLVRDAMRKDGSFIAFRSSITGIAPPAPGGIVMQAFPCMFLNALSPEMAQEQWHLVRQSLDNGNWSRLFWPIDVGNYGFSRASSYAATAAAAVEMGDHEIAEQCFQRLEAECPSQLVDGVIHRKNASLWAHSLELIARCNHTNGFRKIVEGKNEQDGPFLMAAPYGAIHIAGAIAKERNFECTFHPVSNASETTVAIGGLIAGRHYTTNRAEQPCVKADRDGQATLQLNLNGECRLTLAPTIEGKDGWFVAQ